MQFFEILCIILGIATGASLQLLPDPTARERPITPVLLFSLTMGLTVFFLPVIVSSPRFITTLVIALIGSVAGFFTVRALKTDSSDKTGKTAPTMQQPTQA